jgi:hypothetical protein
VLLAPHPGPDDPFNDRRHAKKRKVEDTAEEIADETVPKDDNPKQKKDLNAKKQPYVGEGQDQGRALRPAPRPYVSR